MSDPVFPGHPEGDDLPDESARPRRAPSTEQQLAGLNRSLPFSDEAEKSVLSGLLQDPQDRLSEARLELLPEVFYHGANRAFYETLLDMLDLGLPIEMSSVTQRLRDKELINKVGGPGGVSELYSFIPSRVHYDFYLKVLKDKHKLRQVIKHAADFISEAMDHGREHSDEPVEDFISSCQERIIELTSKQDSKGFKTMREITNDVIMDIEEAFHNQGHIPANRLSLGFTSLDRRTGGLEGNCMFVIAGRPSMGKTSLAMNMVECVATGIGHYKEYNQPPAPVLVFSMEMSAKSLGRRLIVGGAGINLNQVRFGLKSRTDEQKLSERAMLLRKAPIYVVEEGGLSIQQVRSRARIMAKKYGIKFIVIDYLQLMSSHTKRAAQNRSIEIGEISRGCKNMAKELDIPVMVLSQLNREAEGRKGGVPKLSDLREGGDIEQDADIVGLVHRPPYYDDTACETDASLIIAKGRDIGVGDIPLMFFDSTTQFRSCTESLLSNDPEKRDAGSDAQKRASEKRGGKKGRKSERDLLNEAVPDDDD